MAPDYLELFVTSNKNVESMRPQYWPPKASKAAKHAMALGSKSLTLASAVVLSFGFGTAVVH